MAIITTTLQRLKTFIQGQRIKAVEVNAELDQLIVGHNNVRTDLLSIDAQLSGFATKTALQTPGQAQVDWGNIANAPNLADGSWKAAVANLAALPLAGNTVGDQRTVLADTDGKTAVYVCVATVGTVEQQWQKTGDVDWASDEANRVLAENGRVSNEATRVANESTRVSNEVTRVSNEATRVSEFNAIKAEWGQVEIQDVRAEVVAARVDVAFGTAPSLASRLQNVSVRDIPITIPVSLVSNEFVGVIPDMMGFGNGSSADIIPIENYSGNVMLRLFPYTTAYALKTASGAAVTSLKSLAHYHIRFRTDTDPFHYQLLGYEDLDVFKQTNYGEIVNLSATTSMTSAHINRTVVFTGASAQNFTIRTNANVPAAVGSRIEFIMSGAGTVTLVPESGVTFKGDTSGTKRTIDGQGCSMYAVKTAANEWHIIGKVKA